MNPLDMQSCTCAELRKAGRAVTQFYEEALQGTGLKPTQFSLLATLDQTGPLAMGELAAATVTDRTTLTRNLKPLQQRGWVHFSPGTDRRRRQVELSAPGKEALDQALPQWRQAQQSMVQKLGEKQWQALLGLLAASVEALRPA